jgi:AraC-like DNA-binding protein
MAYDFIIEHNGCCTVNELAGQLNLSIRSIHRLFIQDMGIAPKQYIKIIRFNYACRLISNCPEIDLFDVFCTCGYYDQMHFIHEFKEIMNTTPSHFLKICEGHFYFNRPVIMQ